MEAYKLTTTLTKNGTITLDSLPFHAGETVAITIEPKTAQNGQGDLYPLRGTPYRFENPFDPAIPPTDWEACR